MYVEGLGANETEVHQKHAGENNKMLSSLTGPPQPTADFVVSFAFFTCQIRGLPLP